MELPANFEYFERKDAAIAEKLIQDQGEDICRHIISKHYISIHSRDYDFGIIHKTPMAQIGRMTRKRTSQQYAYSFVLCKVHAELRDVDITLICSRPNSRDGKVLMRLVEDISRLKECKTMSLLSIGDTKVLNWYRQQGFILKSEKHYTDGNLKAYSMYKVMDAPVSNTDSFILNNI
jgi:hypothetical protein